MEQSHENKLEASLEKFSTALSNGKSLSGFVNIIKFVGAVIVLVFSVSFVVRDTLKDVQVIKENYIDTKTYEYDKSEQERIRLETLKILKELKTDVSINTDHRKKQEWLDEVKQEARNLNIN